MKTRLSNKPGLGAFLVLVSAVALCAQNHTIDWSTIAGGGGTSAGNQYTLSGTIGQWDAGGPEVAGNYSLTGGFWQLPGGPLLTIRLTGPNTVVVSWPAAALGCFVLQQTASLTAPIWVNTPTPVAYANGVDSVVVPIPPTQQFYRLVSNCQDQ
jgi:hypothetical protein